MRWFWENKMYDLSFIYSSGYIRSVWTRIKFIQQKLKQTTTPAQKFNFNLFINYWDVSWGQRVTASPMHSFCVPCDRKLSSKTAYSPRSCSSSPSIVTVKSIIDVLALISGEYAGFGSLVVMYNINPGITSHSLSPTTTCKW